MQNNFENDKNTVKSSNSNAKHYVKLEDVQTIQNRKNLQKESVLQEEGESFITLTPENMPEENTSKKRAKEKIKKEKASENSSSAQPKLTGLAVLEGVTVLSDSYVVTAVRDPEQSIQIESRRVTPNKFLAFFKYFIFVRGIVYFFSNLLGIGKYLYRSTEMSIDERNNGKVNKWIEDKLKINISSTLTFIFLILLITLAIVAFAWVPVILANKVVALQWQWFTKDSALYFLLIAVERLILFIIYIVIVSFLPTIQRIMRYLGAEHKTLNCVIAKKEVNVHSVSETSRFFERSPVSFLYLTSIASIFVYSILDIFIPDLAIALHSKGLAIFTNILIRIAIVPTTAGLVYELIQLFALSKSNFLLLFKWPNYLIQLLTVREPDEDMIAVAIAAHKVVEDMENGKEVQLTKFIFSRSVRQYLKDLKVRFLENNIDESDAEWLLSVKTDIPRSELAESKTILMPSKIKQLESFVSARLNGKPLWYVLGSTSFYGSEFLVDERVLIPRPETELLCEQAIKIVDKGNKILDLCTGSGCIAITIAKECRQLNLAVTAADISTDALQLAQKNASINGVSINFVESNMFQNIEGKFDLIVCNPPYIKHDDIQNLQSEVKNFEPILALDGGKSGLDFYKILAQEAHKYLLPEGTLLVECGEGQAEEIVKMLEAFEFKMVTRDLNGIDRFIRAML